jgi:hypothetical protein
MMIDATVEPAPFCPDCLGRCQHPLRMPIACDACEGSGRATPTRTCWKCGGLRKLPPAPLSHEQIFGRKCDDCGGKGKVYGPSDRSDCEVCNGTGLVGAAENLWVCLGTRWKPTCSMFSACSVEQHYCEGAAVPCGRTGVVADHETWKRARRRWMSRETVTAISVPLGPRHARDPRWAGVLEFLRELAGVSADATGTWTIAASFSSEEPL